VISLSILFTVPRYLDDHVVKKSDGSMMVARTYLGKNSIFQLIYAGLFYYIVIYGIPIVLLAAMTYRRLIFAFSPLFWRLLAFSVVYVTAKRCLGPFSRFKPVPYFASNVQDQKCHGSVFPNPGTSSPITGKRIVLVQSNCIVDLCLAFLITYCLHR